MIIPAILLSKFLYSKNDIGIYESFLLIASVFSFFWLSAIFNTIFSEEQTDQAKNKNIKLAFWSIHILSILVIIIITISNSLIKYLDSSHFNLLVLYIFFNNPSFIVENKFLLFKQNKPILIYGFFYLLFQICATLFIVINGYNTYYVILFLVLFAAIRYIIALIIVFKNKSKIHTLDLWKLIIKSSPLLISFFISGIAEYIDAFIIKYNFGNSELTLFRYGSREIPFVYILANSLSTSMIPNIRADLKNGLVELKNRSSYLMHLAFISTILLVLSCQYWYPFIFNNSFKDAIPYFLISSLLIISRCIFPQTIIQAKQDSKIILIISIIELIINISSSLIFLHFYGAIGIVFGTVISFIIEKIMLTIYVYNKYQIYPSNYIQLNTYTIYSLILFIAVYFLY